MKIKSTTKVLQKVLHLVLHKVLHYLYIYYYISVLYSINVAPYKLFNLLGKFTLSLKSTTFCYNILTYKHLQQKNVVFL